MKRTISYFCALVGMMVLNSQVSSANVYVGGNYLAIGGEDAKAIYEALNVEAVFDARGSSESGQSQANYKVIEGGYNRPLNARETTFFCSEGINDGRYSCELEGDFSKSSVESEGNSVKIDLGSFLKSTSVGTLTDALSRFENATYSSQDGSLVLHCASRSDCYINVQI
jgi:hypothetical protein